MNAELTIDYYEWLLAKILRHKPPPDPYFRMLRLLHETEFVWFIVGDDNRAAEGRELRRDFFDMTPQYQSDPEFRADVCSVLEMLVGLAQAAEWQTDPVKLFSDWFWEFISNLGLSDFYDDNHWEDEEVLDILNTFMWRQYDFDGRGGLFPLKHAAEDQRNVQIWYQFMAYTIERGFFD